MKELMWRIGSQMESGQGKGQHRRRLVLLVGIALLLLFSQAPAHRVQAAPPLCVMEIATDKSVYHPDEPVQLNMWIKVNTNLDLPEIENTRLEVELRQPFGTFVTLTHRGGISLRKGAEWDEPLLSLPITGETFHNMGDYEVHAVLLSQAGEIYCESYTTFTIDSVFGRMPGTRTLIVTSRRTKLTEPFASKLAVWLEAAYQTDVQVLYQEGLYQSYRSGLYKDYDMLIYYATDYQQSPPPELIKDIFEGDGITKKKVVWIGYHLDKVQAYLRLYGLSYGTLSTGNEAGKLLYLDPAVSYDLRNPDCISVEVINDDLAHARATVDDGSIIVSAKQTYYPEDGECFYFVGFHPTSYIGRFGANLVFLDVLNEVYGIERGKIALVRLEDIHAFTDSQQLLSITSFLRSEGVPFTLALIPVYVGEDGVETRLSQDRDFRIKVKNALLDGGEFVLHGDTHRYDGVTAVDYEFWDEKTDSPIGGADYAEQRVADALMEVEFSGLRPYLAGWETPHCTAGEEAYTVFERYFKLLYEDPRWGFDLKRIPYPVETENNLYVPSNLGYVRVDSPDTDVNTILQEASLLASLRHGALASFHYHPEMGLERLRTIIQGLKEQGWTFKPVSSLLDTE
ncbi:DUF2334 domain-containing protein [Candidatus Bipolaricaulota bacterium]|nr:DUF2334 domain-containing protein [Candidatus Bipolaricaulota bacterium]